MTSNALDRVTTNTADNQPAPPTVGAMIQQLRPELQRALPRGMDADRLARIALTVVRKDVLEAKKAGRSTSLATCNVESFAGALLTAASLGLEPGTNGEAYLVAYKGEATLIIGYQGYAKLFWNSPLAQHLDTQAVHEADEFDYGYGLDPYLRHKPAKGDRGDVTHYYAVAKLTTGASAFAVLTAAEVKELRGGKVGTSGQIADPMHWMERKTALRQLVKMLPRSTQLNQALEADERPGTELRRDQVAALSIEEAPYPVTVPAAELEVSRISQAQTRKMHAALKEMGLDDRAERLQITAALVGRDVESANDLTRDEASRLIDALEQCLGEPDPAEALRTLAGLGQLGFDG